MHLDDVRPVSVRYHLRRRLSCRQHLQHQYLVGHLRPVRLRYDVQRRLPDASNLQHGYVFGDLRILRAAAVRQLPGRLQLRPVHPSVRLRPKLRRLGLCAGLQMRRQRLVDDLRAMRLRYHLRRRLCGGSKLQHRSQQRLVRLLPARFDLWRLQSKLLGHNFGDVQRIFRLPLGTLAQRRQWRLHASDMPGLR